VKIHFTKMHGAGNDFIMIDDRAGTVPWQDHFLMAALAGRRTGIGAEGIILIQQSEKADFFLRFLNPDGTEADLCGNGSRCSATFANAIGACGTSLTMETRAGVVDAQLLENGTVRIWMPEPLNRNYGMELKIGEETWKCDYIVTGVPHLVVPVPNVADVDVTGLGKALRLHAAFAPDGTNVDFVSMRQPNRMIMRTYERGVEGESGACGTGAVACAVVAVERFGFTLPSQIKTSSGYDLTVDGDWRRKKCTGMTLTGPVKFVFSGDIELDEVDLGNEID